jgi:hypothetical protein
MLMLHSAYPAGFVPPGLAAFARPRRKAALPALRPARLFPLLLFGPRPATTQTSCRHSGRIRSTRFGGTAASPLGEGNLDRDRFEKIIAIAVNPATYEEEAMTALRKARELVKENRALAHPAPPPPPPPPDPPRQDYSFRVEITNIPPDWLTIVAHNLSKAAYGLGLKSKIEYDFTDAPLSLDVRADGPKQACCAFEHHFTWLVDFVNSQQRQPKICSVRSLAACEGA